MYNLVCGGDGGVPLALINRINKASLLNNLYTCPMTMLLVNGDTSRITFCTCVVPFFVSATINSVVSKVVILALGGYNILSGVRGKLGWDFVSDHALQCGGVTLVL